MIYLKDNYGIVHAFDENESVKLLIDLNDHFIKITKSEYNKLKDKYTIQDLIDDKLQGKKVQKRPAGKSRD